MKKHAEKCCSNEGRQVCDCDGYHTFKELYDHRIALWQALLSLQADINNEVGVGRNEIWKSTKHYDDTVYDGWFISGLRMKQGQQMTYHLPMSEWASTPGIELDRAPEWDGHTSDDVITRLKTLL